MPRKAPKEVIEHRITLGNFEREVLTRTISEEREARYWTAGINQIGQIAGSGVLLYGLIAYFGYNILDDLTDGVKKWVDKTSTNLADMVGDALNVPLNTEEADAIINANDRIDEAIVYEREQSKINNIAFNAFFAQFRNGEITVEEFYAGQGQFPARSAELEQLTNDIAHARRQVKIVQAFTASGSNPDVPAWLALKDWRALLIASYTDGYNPSGTDMLAQRTYSERGTDWFDY